MGCARALDKKTADLSNLYFWSDHPAAATSFILVYGQLGLSSASSDFLVSSGEVGAGEGERFGEGDRERRFCVSISVANVDILCAAKRLRPGGDMGGEANAHSGSGGGV